MISISLLDLRHSGFKETDNYLNYLIPEQLTRYHTLRSTKRRREYLWSRILINELVLSFQSTGFLVKSYRDTDRGPVLTNVGVNYFLSLSHSNDAIVVAISDSPIGVDIERVKAKSDYVEMAKMFMTNDEIADFEMWDITRQRYYFYDLWVAKEAIFKTKLKPEQAGASIANITIENFQGSVVTLPCLDGEYMMAIAVKK